MDAILHIIAWIGGAGLGVIASIIAHAQGKSTATKQVERRSRPVQKFEILTLPLNNELAPVDPVGRVAKTIANRLAKDSLVVCEQGKTGYEVIVRNTMHGWKANWGWEGKYWEEYNRDTDTRIGFVSMDDPNFHDKLIKLQDKAADRAAILGSVA